MSQQTSQQPSPMELPPVPGAEIIDDNKDRSGVTHQGSERNPEFVPPATVPASQPQDDAPQAGGTPTPGSVPEDPAPAHQSTATHSSASSSPAIADDVDLIEKEWVEKAKEIVEKTRENPYLQNKALNEMKADYIKKRYNKELTKSEE